MHRWVKQQMGMVRQEYVYLPDELGHHLQGQDCKWRSCHRLLGLYIRVAINFSHLFILLVGYLISFLGLTFHFVVFGTDPGS